MTLLVFWIDCVGLSGDSSIVLLVFWIDCVGLSGDSSIALRVLWIDDAGRNGDVRLSDDRDMSGDDVAGLWTGYHNALGLKKSTPPTPREQSSPLMLDRSMAHETSSVHDETSSSGNKEDEDDDEDESEDKIDPHSYDPERLKAFNVS
uniref:Uncharacterized protein n=1 Tax=Timema douglasi TaxID=61478 RepID=A0A7R8VJ98_TIMDO|nr:unnamed protein product [Timema douglasi]